MNKLEFNVECVCCRTKYKINIDNEWVCPNCGGVNFKIAKTNK
jgi:Zn finger protein HypA/HybF involved in hydrogenase expression